MTRRPQQHLAEVTRPLGTNAATDALRALMAAGLRARNEAEQAERTAQRGDALKHNPHISDAGKCLRQVTYSLMNAEESEPLTDDSLMNFLVGHAVEEAWAAILTASGAEVIREGRVSIEAGSTVVTGRKDFDGIRIRKDLAILELKSTSSRAMSFLLKSGEHGKAEHRKQLNLYLHAEGYEVGYLIYLVKDATRGEPILHAFEVRHDDEMARDDIQSLVLADELARRNEPPPIPTGNVQSKFPCSYCSYKTTCWLEASIAAKEGAA